MGGPGGVTGFGRRLPQLYWQWSGLQPMGVPCMGLFFIRIRPVRLAVA